MESHQLISLEGLLMLFVLNGLINVDLSRADSILHNGGQTITSESLDYHTYIILYKDSANDRNAINCTAPRNVTLPTMESAMLQKWTAPSGVHLMMAPSLDKNSVDSGEGGKNQIASIESDKTEKPEKPWVELKPDGTLVFHNPDDSISGAYVCQSTADDQMVYQTTVWVHVFTKNPFDVMERIQVAIITTVIFLAFILLCWGVNYWCQRSRVRYTLAKRHEDPINMPTIQIVGASDEKI